MYELTWITSQLAAGPAPMSYEDLGEIRAAGITAIINLCGEFTDLHTIEEDFGFEVYHLPIPDEHAPAMDELERALEWLDEAIYLGKKVLVHCRHGHGRTGTLISAFLVRKGLGLKKAEKLLKNTRANPTNYSQWKLLRKYNRKEGVLTSASPELEKKSSVDLGPFLADYRAIVAELSAELERLGTEGGCGLVADECCFDYFEMQLAEVIGLHTMINERFSRDRRQRISERARDFLVAIRVIRTLHRRYEPLRERSFTEIFAASGTPCPLLEGGKCLAPELRPLRCRWYRAGLEEKRRDHYADLVSRLSENIFLALTGSFIPAEPLRFSMADTVSGRYVQTCFQAMMAS